MERDDTLPQEERAIMTKYPWGRGVITTNHSR